MARPPSALVALTFATILLVLLVVAPLPISAVPTATPVVELFGNNFEGLGAALDMKDGWMVVGNGAFSPVSVYQCTELGCGFFQTLPLPASLGAYGASVSISFPFVAVSDSQFGSVHLYYCNLVSCALNYTYSDVAVGFGTSISINGELLAVASNNGAHMLLCDIAGCVQLYLRLPGEGSTSCSLVAVSQNGLVASTFSGFGTTLRFNRCDVKAGTCVDLIASFSTPAVARSLSVESNRVAVGYPLDVSLKGTVRVYSCNLVGCSLLISRTASVSGDRFGASVAFGANNLVVGAPGAYSGKGSAYIINCSPSCSLELEVNATDGLPGDSFGFAVGISDNLLIVASPDSRGSNGTVYSFTLCIYGNLVSGNCMCLSGWGNADCSQSTHGICSLPTVAPLKTENVAEFITGYSLVSSNTFTFAIESDARNQRFVPSITVGPAAECKYPGPQIIRSFNLELCRDTFVGNISMLDLVSQCGWTAGPSPDGLELHVQGTVDVTVVDEVAVFNGIPVTRLTHGYLELRLVFPLVVNVTVFNLTVDASAQILAAVTEQSFDTEIDTGTVILMTSLAWPFFLVAPTIVITPNPSFVATIKLFDDSSCSQIGVNTPCTQAWQISIGNVAASRTCSLDGSYTFSWILECRSGFTGPFTQNATVVVVQATLASENVCGSVSIVTNLVGTLVAYDSNSFSTPTLAFLGNSKIFFLASVTGGVSIASVHVDAVRITVGSTTVPVVVGSLGVHPSLNYTEVLGNPNEVGFVLTAVYGNGTSLPFVVFDTSMGQDMFTFQVTVDLLVGYNTSFSTFTKRKRGAEVAKISLTRNLVFNPYDSVPLVSEGKAALIHTRREVIANSAVGLTIPALASMLFALMSSVLLPMLLLL